MRLLLGAECDQLFLLEGLGFRIQDLGSRGWGLGFAVLGLGFRVEGLRLRVWGLGFRV